MSFPYNFWEILWNCYVKILLPQTVWHIKIQITRWGWYKSNLGSSNITTTWSKWFCKSSHHDIYISCIHAQELANTSSSLPYCSNAVGLIQICICLGYKRKILSWSSLGISFENRSFLVKIDISSAVLEWVPM